MSGEGWRERKCLLAPPAPEMERWRRGAAAGRLTVPKDVHMLSPLHGKWDFTDVIKDAEMGGDTLIIGLRGPNIILRVLERWNWGSEESEPHSWPHKQDSAQRCWGKGPPVKEGSSFQKLGEARNHASSWSFQKEHSPADTLTLVWWDLF